MYDACRKLISAIFSHIVAIFLGESYAEYMAGRAYVYNTASSVKLDSVGDGLDCDGVKLYCGPMAKKVADNAMQLMGGYGSEASIGHQ